MYIDQLIAHMQENKYVYMLESKVKLGWYLIDYGVPVQKVGDNVSAAVWFPNRQIAVKFETEESIEEFQSKYITPRPSAIVRIEIEELLRRL